MFWRKIGKGLFIMEVRKKMLYNLLEREINRERAIWGSSFICTIVFILITIGNLHAQINIFIENPSQQTYYLQQIKGDRIYTIDSTQLKEREINFQWKEDYQPGMYRLFDGEKGILFWTDKNEVKFNLNVSFDQSSLQVIKSIENRIWLDYVEHKNKNYQNLDLLNPIINWYDQESEFYKKAEKEFENQQKLLPEYVDHLKNEYPNTWILPFIKADLKPVLPMGLNFEEQKGYLKEHWFDGVDWYENSLIYSDILTNKITEYLGLYADKNQNKAMLELAFKYAVDQIIPKTQGNPEMYAYIIDYLVRGFERYNFEEVILHIAMNYPPPEQKCENEARKSEALARLEKYESMQIGQTAPDIVLPNMQGEMIKLSETQKEKILIVFWASWCPHCKQIIPQIQKWYTKEVQEKWQVYTISIDMGKADLENFLKIKNIQIQTLCNYQGWDTQAAIDYNIYATPTMIVLDSELKILAKPTSIGELK